MSREVDQRIVEMRFDNKDFEKNVDSTRKSLSSLKDNVDSATFEKFGSVLDTISSKFSVMGTAGDQVIRMLTEKFVGLTSQATAFYKSLSTDQISAGMSKYTQKTEAMATIMAATGKSTEEVNETLAKLSKYADETSYSFTDMTSNIGKFTSVGVELETAENAMEGIASWAAKSGVDAAGASRAMYNISQAMGVGKMTAIDWKSIENAGMATKEFREEAIKSAEALGYLKREGDKLYDNTGTEVNFKNFRDTLKSGWFQSAVMLDVFSKYSDVTTEFGKAAKAAAAESKTFQHAVETVKDEISSGWMTTFEYIFGNIDEAKKLWTEVGNMLSAFFNRNEKARNQMFKAWHDNGGRELMIESLRAIYDTIMSIMEAAKQGFREVFPKMTGKRLLELTWKIRNFTTSLVPTEEQLEKIRNIVRGFSHIFVGFRKILDAIIKPFKSIGKESKKSGEGVNKFLSVLEKIAGKIEEVVDSKGFEKFTNGISKVISKIISVFQKLFNYVSEKFPVIKDKIKTFFEGLREFFDPVIQYFKGLWEKIFPKDSIDKAKEKLAGLTDFASGIGLGLKTKKVKAKDLLQEKINKYGEDSLIVKKFRDLHPELADDGEETVSIFERLKEKLQPLIDFFKKVGDVLKAIWEKVKPVVTVMWNWLTDTLGKIADKIKEAPPIDLKKGFFGTLFSLLGLFAGGLGLKGLANMNKATGGIADALSNFGKNGLLGFLTGGKDNPIFGFLNGLTDTLKAMQKEILAKAIKEIATAVIMLVAAVVVLSFIDTEKADAAVVTVTTLVGDLIALLITATVASKKSDETGMAKVGAAIMLMSAGVLLLAAAVAKLSKIDSKAMWRGVDAVTYLMAGIAASIRIMSTDSKSLGGAAAAMLAFALAMLLLVIPIKILGKMEMEVLIKGIGSVGAMMLLMAASIRIMSSGKALKAAAAIIALSIAINLLVIPVKKLGSMDWESLAKGLVGITLLLGGITASLRVLAGQKGLIAASVAIGIVAASFLLLAAALSIIKDIEWDQMLVSVLGLSVALAAITVALKVLVAGSSKASELVVAAAAVIIMAAAIDLIAAAIYLLKDISWDHMLISVGGLVLVLAAMTAAAILAKKSIAGAGAMALMAGAILTLAPAIMMFSKLSWKEMGVALLTIAGALAAFVVAAWAVSPVIKPLLALAVTITAFGTAVLMIGSAVLLAGMGIMKIVEALALLKVIGPSAMTLFSSLIDVIVNKIPQIGIALAQAVVVFVTAIAQKIPVLLKTLFETVTTVMGQLIEYVPTILTQIMELVGTILDNLINNLPEIVTKLLVLVDSLLTALEENLPSILEHIMSIIGIVLDSLVENIPEIGQKIIDLIIGFLDVLVENIGPIVERLLDVLINLLNGVANRIGDLVDSVVDIVINLIEALGGRLQDIMETLVQFVIDAINAIAETIRNKAMDFYDAIKNLVTAIFEAIVNVATAMITDIKELGKKIMESGFIQGIKDKFQKIRTTVREFIDNAKKVIKEKIDQWKQAGRDLIEGLIKGVKEKFEAVKEAAVNAVSNAVSAVKNFLGIKSPSKVFAEIGRYSDEGLVVGLKKYSGAVKDASVNVGKEAVDGMQLALEGIYDLLESDMDYNPTITPVVDLSEAEAGLADLSELMNKNTYSVNGLANIRTPESAYGDRLLSKIDQLNNANSNSVGTINVYVSGAEGQDVNEIADAVINRINHEIVRGKAAYA